jgi:hypothetical protein
MQSLHVREQHTCEINISLILELLPGFGAEEPGLCFMGTPSLRLGAAWAGAASRCFGSGVSSLESFESLDEFPSLPAVVVGFFVGASLGSVVGLEALSLSSSELSAIN